MTLRLNWNFDKPYYSPADKAMVNLWLENYGNAHVYVSQIQVEFEFGVYKLPQAVCGTVGPSNVGFLGSVSLELPQNRVGSQKFNVKYKVHELLNQNWVPRPTYVTPHFIINIFSTPTYKIFLSRGIRREDRMIGDPIAQMLLEWGCDPVTVGIDIHVPDSEVPSEIERQIQYSKGLIAIATPRVIELSTQVWYTMEWLHGESAIAYVKRKPILILKDKSVLLGGLPSYLNPQRQLEFDSLDLNDLKAKLCLIMPWFRAAVEQSNTKEFYKTLGEVVVKGMAAFGVIALIGIIGSIVDTE